MNCDERVLVGLIRAANPLGAGAVSVPKVDAGEWSHIAQTAQQQGVASLLYQSITVSGLKNQLPTNVAEALRGSYAQTIIANHWAFQELSELLPLFNRERIPLILLKGCALAATLYGGNGVRRVGDLDMLIRYSDFPRMRELLRARGYVLFFNEEVARNIPTRFGHEQAFWREGDRPSQVDIHWHLLGFSYYSDRIPIEWLWHRTSQIQVEGQPAKIFSPSAQLLHLSAHFALHHLCKGLKWSYDLALLLTRDAQRIDWAETLKAAHDLGLTQVLQMALETVEQTWGVRVPIEITTRLRTAQSSLGDRLAFRVTMAPQRGAWYIFEFLRRVTWAEKINYLRIIVFPNFSYMRARYRIKYPLLSPFYYFGRVCKGAYKLVQSLTSIATRR